jgi:ketosteroid isomerase-like protein
MRIRLVALALTCFASPAFSQQCNEAEKLELQEFDKAWSEATRRGDRAQLNAIIADDFASATINGTVDKAATIDAAVRAAEQSRASGQAPPVTVYDSYVITCTPTSAVVTHRNSTPTTAGGTDVTSYSRSVHVMEKRGGRWQVVGNAGHALSDAALVLYMENDWNEARKRKDIAWFERNIADDATLSTSAGTVQSKRHALAAIAADKRVMESVEALEPNVRVEGNTAIVTGISRYRGRDEQGKPFEQRVRFTGVFIKRDGRWLVWATQGTNIP